MSSSNWTTDFLNQLNNTEFFIVPTRLRRNVAYATHSQKDNKYDKTVLWQIESKHWQQFSQYAFEQKLRWVSGWAEHAETLFIVNACFEKEGIYLLLRTQINTAKPELPSQATVYPAANRSERHTQDMFGINFAGHPDNRRWTRHQ
ncbi:MAG: NADH-quinone oxidoreductase subunit C, partial [Methylococcaceae bacterium]|nr:NADH-quinone oxidoreductase subunit C [Methylococcaceae bacterium]